MGVLLTILMLQILPSFAQTTPVADPIGVLKNEKGEVLLRANSCPLLQQQVVALKAWTKKLGEHADRRAKCDCDAGRCEVNVSDVAPDLVVAMQDSCPINNGPNCWNATLVSSKILPSLRYSSEDEMSFWLNSPLCRELAKDETPEPGDVIAVRSPYVGEVHGFIYLSDELCFSKNGYSESQYLLQSCKDVFKTYEVKSYRERMLTSKSSTDGNYANWYRCETFEEWEKHADKGAKKVMKTTMGVLDTAECALSHDALNGGTANVNALQKQFEIFSEMARKSKSDLVLERQTLQNDTNLSAKAKSSKLREIDDEIFMWEIVESRSNGSLQQFSDLKQ